MTFVKLNDFGAFHDFMTLTSDSEGAFMSKLKPYHQEFVRYCDLSIFVPWS